MPEIENAEQITKGFLQADDIKENEAILKLKRDTIRVQEGNYGAQLFLDVEYNGQPFTWTPTGKGARFLFEKFGTNTDKWPDQIPVVKESHIGKDGKTHKLYPKGSV